MGALKQSSNEAAPQQPHWPLAVQAGKDQRMVLISQLPPETKRQLFRGMQKERPELLALYRDPMLQALRKAFDASMALPRREYLALLAAGAE